MCGIERCSLFIESNRHMLSAYVMTAFRFAIRECSAAGDTSNISILIYIPETDILAKIISSLFLSLSFTDGMVYHIGLFYYIVLRL